MLKGQQVALPTPFKDGEADGPALRDLVSWDIDQGVRGLLVLGTTGEAPTMTDAEHHRVIELVVKAAAGRVPVVAGCGTNSTTKTIMYAEQARDAGADAVLAVTPYYNKPSQEGLYQHYKALCDAIDIPVILYNHPGRCVVELSVETVVRLAKLRNIIGIKDSNPDLRRVTLLRRALGKDFLLVSGDESTGLGYMASGGDTMWTTVGSIVPERMGAVHDAFDAGDLDHAFDVFKDVVPLILSMYVESNPVPLKYALSLLGRCTPEVRLPLTELGDASKTAVRKALIEAGVSLPAREPVAQPA